MFMGRRKIKYGKYTPKESGFFEKLKKIIEKIIKM